MKAQMLMMATFLGLVLGLSGASTFVVVREGRAKMVAMRGPGGGNAPVDTASSIPSEPVEAAAAEVPEPVVVDTQSTAAPSALGAVPSPAPLPAVDSVRVAVEDSFALRTEQLVKMFGAMPARDAARVLGEMGDAEVATVLSRMRDRQASAILSNLPPQRAAAISRSVIRSDRRSR